MNLIERIFSQQGFMPHGMCYEWNPAVIWLHVVSDALITLAYYSIPITLLYFVRKRKDLVFDWIFILFAAFIIACGTTHLMEIINIWHPTYWLSGIIKAITAVTSIVTAILLIKLVPQALALPSPEQLRKSNAALEEEIRERAKASEKIEALNRDLLLQTEKLALSNQELETFSASVAHDFRAPLRVIIGYSEMEMADNGEKLPASTVHVLQRIIGSAEKLNRMMSDLLSYHRASRENLPLETIDLDRLVAEIAREPQFAMGRIEIKAGLGTVRSNAVALKIILQNLFSNALKFVKEGVTPEIEIFAERNGNGTTVYVQDNGLGIDEGDQANLFKLFYRGRQVRNIEGTGLGLGTSQKAAHRVGVGLRLVHSTAEGSCFSISFPAT